MIPGGRIWGRVPIPLITKIVNISWWKSNLCPIYCQGRVVVHGADPTYLQVRGECRNARRLRPRHMRDPRALQARGPA